MGIHKRTSDHLDITYEDRIYTLIDKPMLEPNQRRARVGMPRSNERIC